MSGRIYIAGCGGMLGEAFYAQFKGEHELRCTDIDLNEPWLEHCDIRDAREYTADVERFKPDYLFHLGALTDLEYCERHIDEAYRTNTLAVENAVLIANRLDIPILYISTAGIFSGDQDFYDDWDVPGPIGHYARSKYTGEIYVRENARRHLVCRPGWMMGAGPNKDKKFVQKVMHQLREGRRELFVVSDKLGTPTYTHDFARNVKLLLEREYWGHYNMACSGQASRVDVARELVSILGLHGVVTVTEVSSDYFQKEYFAPRPASEQLINRKLDLRKVNVMRHWTVALREYVQEYYHQYVSVSA